MTDIAALCGSVNTALVRFDKGIGSSSKTGSEWFSALCQVVESCLVSDMHQSLESQMHYISIILQQRYGDLISSAVDNFTSQCFIEFGKTADSHVEQQLGSFVRLGLARVYQDVVITVLERHIVMYVKEITNGNYDRAFVPSLNRWMDRALTTFLKTVFGSDVVDFESKLQVLYERMEAALVRSRSDELFDIVTEFPDSMAAVKELRDVANRTNSLHVVGKIFGKALSRRLLHIGASTGQILEMYVSVIRVLRVIDPSDALLVFVTKPVRKYLKERKDTIRSIVTALTQPKQGSGGESSELHGELKKGGGSLSHGVPLSDDEDISGANAEEWMPARRHPDISYSQGRGFDILALLVSIYVSTDMFVSEYRSLLSEKLLQLADYDGDAEISTLELLKIR
jgi:anaphase-promoting complex subunit 2